MLTFFANLKLAYKIGAIFLVMTGVSLSVSGLTWRNTATLEQAAKMTEHTYQVIGQANRVTAAMVDGETGVRGYLVSANEGFLAPYLASDRLFADALKEATRLTADNPSQQQRLAEIGKIGGAWRVEVAEKEIALMKNAQTQADARQIEASGAGKKYMDSVRARVKEVIDAEASLLDARSAAAAAAASASYTMTIGGGVGMVAIALLGLFILNLGVSRPIKGMTEAMSRLAANDLAVEIKNAARRDEVGDMAKAVQVFKDNAIRVQKLELEQKAMELRAGQQRKADMQKLANDFETAVGEIIQTVSSAAIELEASANTLTSTAEKTEQLSTVVSTAAEEASANVQSVASASEEMASSVNEISRQVQESARIANDAVNQAQNTNSKVLELSQAANKIGDVVELINTIAGQTNLLALNATIEAARAGDSGRGFAVVASEVKSLAEQTARATGEIAEQIKGIQTATADSVEAIKEIGATISRISEIATTIASAVEEQGAATQEISRNVQQAAQGTTQVASNISDVQRGSSETGSASSQVLSSAQSLSVESTRLKTEVRNFLETVRAA